MIAAVTSTLLVFVSLTGPSIPTDERWLESFRTELVRGLGHHGAAALLDLPSNRVVVHHNIDALARPSRVGSILKLVAAASFLKHDGTESPYRCRGKDVIAGRERVCWHKPGHGVMHLGRAITESCNLYFHEHAQHLHPDDYIATLDSYGFGKLTGYHTDEVPGRVPKTLSIKGLVNAAIGDNRQLVVTGLQVLKFVGILSGVGPLAGRGGVAEQTLREAMVDVVERGTASPRVLDMRIAGKTGTASRYNHWAYDGWFAGYFPVERPRYAFVFRKRDSTGAHASAHFQKLLARSLRVAR